MRRPDGDDQPVHAAGLQGRRLHLQRPPASAARAVGKAMRAIDLGAELGAKIYVFWGGREGTEVGRRQGPARRARALPRGASTSSASTCVDQGYDLRFALEAKPNEPRGDIFLPTAGHMLALHLRRSITPRWSASTPRSRTRRWPGLDSSHARRPGAVGRQAVPHRPQRPAAGPLRPGLPLRRRGPQGGLLPGASCWSAPATTGPRHFDAHAYRNEDAEGVWDFARGCMRTYTAPRRDAPAISTRCREVAGGAGGRVGAGRSARRRCAGADESERAQGGGRSTLDPLGRARLRATSGSTNWSSSVLLGAG